MIAPNSLPHTHFGSGRRVRVGSGPGALAGALALLLASLAPAPAAQSRLDQVSSVDRAGRARTVRGIVKENTLTATVVEVAGEEREIDSADVRSVSFGAVPDSFEQGVAYDERGDYENAAAQFQAAATDGDARAVVRAEARLRAARTWIRLGSSDPAAFEQARAQVERFLEEHPDNRDVPDARELLGRVQWLGGDPAAAAKTFAALASELSGSTPPTGYSLELCHGAALDAARCTLESGDPDAARGLYASLASAVTSTLAGSDLDDETRYRLENVQTEARLGEGSCLLASGSTTQAKTFFDGQLSGAPKTGAQRFGARFGLAQCLFAEARYREASIEFAQVSAIDHTSRDRTARALIGLAECALKLADPEGRPRAKRWLETVLNTYGDTPSVLRARELSMGL